MGVDIFSTVNGDPYEIIAVDWQETPHAHVIKADLPGLKRENVKLQMHSGVMEISAKQQEQDENGDDKDATWHVRERPIIGTRVRRLGLPENADVDAVKAAMGADGVLTVTIPKKPKPHVRQVEIEEIRNEGIAKKIVKSIKGIMAPAKAK